MEGGKPLQPSSFHLYIRIGTPFEAACSFPSWALPIFPPEPICPGLRLPGGAIQPLITRISSFHLVGLSFFLCGLNSDRPLPTLFHPRLAAHFYQSTTRPRPPLVSQAELPASLPRSVPGAWISSVGNHQAISLVHGLASTVSSSSLSGDARLFRFPARKRPEFPPSLF